MQLKNLPKTCGDCASAKLYNWFASNDHYCSMSSTNSTNSVTDISAFKVDLDTKPTWCPLDRINKSLKHVNNRDKVVIKGLAALFGATDVLEEEEKDAVTVVRCENCKYLRDHSLDILHRSLPKDQWWCSAENYPENKSIPKGWFCAGGERKEDK